MFCMVVCLVERTNQLQRKACYIFSHSTLVGSPTEHPPAVRFRLPLLPVVVVFIVVVIVVVFVFVVMLVVLQF